MTRRAAASPDRLGDWCGWVLAFAAALSPLVAWLGPLGFAPLAGLVGLLVLPALRVSDDDRPAAIAVLVALIWACGSMLWSPHLPKDLEGATSLKLALQAPLYWAGVCAARRASPGALTWALRVFAWGMAGLGLLLIAEGLTGARLYQTLRIAMADPIRPDLAAKNVAQAAFVLAVVWAPAALAGARVGAGRWLGLPMVAGVIVASLGFGADAPVIALLAGVLAALALWRWPAGGPRGLAVVGGVFFLATPLILGGLRSAGVFEQIRHGAPLSWAHRMGYWDKALDWIAAHPLRGWGLDASRAFGPGIQLHPHDSALQLWLELGLIGAVSAAVFWAVIFMRMRRPAPDPAACVAACAAAAYLVIGAVSFGIWQEWWLAVGGLAALLCAAVQRQAVAAPKDQTAAKSAQPSTMAPISE